MKAAADILFNNSNRAYGLNLIPKSTPDTPVRSLQANKHKVSATSDELDVFLQANLDI